MKKKFAAVLIVPLAFALCGCLSLRRSDGSRFYSMGDWSDSKAGYQETEEERAIEYPYEMWGTWKRRLCKIKFVDSKSLEFTVPQAASQTTYRFSYEMLEVIGWWRNYPTESEESGVVLIVVNQDSGKRDRMEMTLGDRAGVEEAEQSDRYFHFYTHDKSYIQALAAHRTSRTPDFVKNQRRVVRLNFPLWNEEQKIKADEKKEYWKEHGNDWIR